MPDTALFRGFTQNVECHISLMETRVMPDVYMGYSICDRRGNVKGLAKPKGDTGGLEHAWEHRQMCQNTGNNPPPGGS